jgi:hypothetical protein
MSTPPISRIQPSGLMKYSSPSCAHQVQRGGERKKGCWYHKSLGECYLIAKNHEPLLFARFGAAVSLRAHILIRLALTAVSARGQCISMLRGKTSTPRIIKCVRLWGVNSTNWGRCQTSPSGQVTVTADSYLRLPAKICEPDDKPLISPSPCIRWASQTLNHRLLG